MSVAANAIAATAAIATFGILVFTAYLCLPRLAALYFEWRGAA